MRGRSFRGALRWSFDARADPARRTFTGNSATSRTAARGGAVGNFGAGLIVVEQGAFAGTAAAGGLFNGNLAAETSPVVRTVANRFVGSTPPGFGTVPG